MDDQRTTATQLMIEAIGAMRRARGIPPWEDDLIEIAEPGDELWVHWQEDSGHTMRGDPARSEIALNVDCFGAYYGCVEAAIADLPNYFAVEEALADSQAGEDLLPTDLEGEA